MAYINTLLQGGPVPEGYFDEDNIAFIQNKIRRILRREFVQNVIIDKGSVVRVMHRIVAERKEPIPRMNRRVIMSLCNEVRDHQLEVNRNLKWENHYKESQSLYDATTDRGPDIYSIKLRDRFIDEKVGGGTVRFYFT
jgi:hypothetical protein